MNLARHWAGNDGFPVVCLPAFSTDRAVTAAAFDPALAAAGGLLRCYVDLPGHGESPAGPATSDGVADLLSGFLERELPGQRFLLAGWSYGGYIAAALARRRPADVAGMLLVCPGVTIDMDGRNLPDGPAGGDDPGWLDDVPAHLREHLSLALGNRTRETALQVSRVLTASAPGDEEYRQRLRTDGYRLSDEDSALPYRGPTAIITGRQDRIVGYADQFRRLSCYPAGSFTVLDRAGHYLPFEQPQALATLVSQWRARCPAAQPSVR
jgi:pimeloyl-ACP methyl ester carboxylesterase